MNKLIYKYNLLKKILLSYKKVLIAFSGGVDSTLLLKTAVDVLGENNVISITLVSPLISLRNIGRVIKMSNLIGVKNFLLRIDKIEALDFSEEGERCYLCKRRMYNKLKDIAGFFDIEYIADGSNYDDRAEYRPGRAAAVEFNIETPLEKAGILKEDVRRILFLFSIFNWNEPSESCLATRFPTNTELTTDNLLKVELAEDFIKNNGYNFVRVRTHGDIARIELLQKDMENFIKERNNIKTDIYLKGLGYKYASLDLSGYRTGSMDKYG